MATNYDRRPGETNLEWYRRIAKVADQRLVRLEKLAQDEHFKNVEKWAYAGALNDIHRWSGDNAKRFNTAPPKDDRELLSKIKDIQSFIEKPTSSKRGIVEIYKKRADSINKKQGTKFTWQQIATYFESGLADKSDKQLGSATTALFIINERIKKLDKIQSDIEEANDSIVRVSGNDAINEKVNEWLSANKLDIDKLFGSNESDKIKNSKGGRKNETNKTRGKSSKNKKKAVRKKKK